MQRRDLNAADAPAPAGQYTQAVEVTGASRTLYVSGQVGIAADGTVPDDVVAQSRLAWANLAAQLSAAGMTLDNVVKIVTILPDAADIAGSRIGRQEALGDRKPASTLIIGGLANPAWKIEVEAVAVA
jgi:enamine deaminase RidA (YjgF/YER057c/UK114 family)